MKINKLLVTTQKEIFENISQRFTLEEVPQESQFQVHFGQNNITEEDENIILVYISNITDISWLEYIQENYLFEKVVFLGYAMSELNFDLKEGDVIMPNSFISGDSSEKGIFLEYAVGKNYDLTQFGLILSGICYSSENITSETIQKLQEDGIDVYDSGVFSILTTLKKQELLDKTVVMQGVLSDKTKTTVTCKNLLQILEITL
ncbi:MAG: hypothetical protein GY828_07435 [Candidatus Gracilibacteria bacterium]|nr:hypothetical protein [Candidatus Gracilibacteria bacterium]